jgi:hypothetical protein
MTRRQIEIDRVSTAFELRYNLFRRKGQPDLCCAVPEDRPVPSFVTGERWEFGGTWEGAIRPPGWDPTASELGVRLNGFHLFQIAGPLESLRKSEYPEQCAVCGEPGRGEKLELLLDNGRNVLLLRDARGAVIGVISTVVDISTSPGPEAAAVSGPEALFGLRHAKGTASLQQSQPTMNEVASDSSALPRE